MALDVGTEICRALAPGAAIVAGHGHAISWTELLAYVCHRLLLSAKPGRGLNSLSPGTLADAPTDYCRPQA